ncbi:hypothetical protein [Shewanella sp. FJAT-52076]|uniref:hypothetical protein n=1 Tax=Shewanella sp. FJAT-52076 TaxID=2864202 RepID=UPI001C658920|nr:hypothetical protein [Shewanella sp. FJAT-52076]QYJ75320.1 hypothetical protein K0H79_18605 [Shewanella sp. FJAT-52076]
MSLNQSEAVIELGKRLVTQLSIDNHDILSSWMAHRIAELIKEAEKCADDSEVAEACSTAILSLWEHRSALPKHLRPLGDLEPVIRTLVALGVSDDEHHFYRPALREAAIADVEGDVKEWLDVAIGLDYSARLLIRYALKNAAEKSVLKAEPWVQLALEAGANEGAEALLVKFTLDKEVNSELETKKAYLQERLSRLRGFVALASEAVESIEAELEALES